MTDANACSCRTIMTSPVTSQRRSQATLVGLIVLSMGCGDAVVAVNGTVSIEQQPAPQGRVRAIPTSGGSARSVPIEAGEFAFAEENALAPGEYRLEVFAQEPTGRRVQDPDRPDEPMDEMRELVHRESIDVSPSAGNGINIDLRRPKPRRR